DGKPLLGRMVAAAEMLERADRDDPVERLRIVVVLPVRDDHPRPRVRRPFLESLLVSEAQRQADRLADVPLIVQIAQQRAPAASDIEDPRAWARSSGVG